MNVILQSAIPPEMHGDVRLPGAAPCAPDDWLRVDDAYAAQMAYRLELMEKAPNTVLWCAPDAVAAAQEVLEEALKILPTLGLEVRQKSVRCPDGRIVELTNSDPLRTLGALVQQDICILQKQGKEHVLTGAVVCFPANWRLQEKVGRPLNAINEPVAHYDQTVARRVQRLFDGVRVGRPLWRFNRLSYVEADLHQPQRENVDGRLRFTRSERQCMLRLPATDAVVFAIHTFVVKQENVPPP